MVRLILSVQQLLIVPLILLLVLGCHLANGKKYGGAVSKCFLGHWYLYYTCSKRLIGEYLGNFPEKNFWKKI